MEERVCVGADEVQGLGEKVAKSMIAKGALELLKEAEAKAFKEEMPQRL